MDISTSLTLLSIFCLHFVLWFLYFGVQGSWGSGSKWWALAALITAASVSLLRQSEDLQSPAFLIGYALLNINSCVHWAGLRVHFREALPNAQGLGIFLLSVGASVVAAVVQEKSSLLVLASSYCLGVAYTSSLIAMDIARHNRHAQKIAFDFLKRISVSEVVLVLGLLGWFWLPQPQQLSIPQLKALLLIYLVVMFVRMSAYFVIYIKDLQAKEIETRDALSAKEGELSALITNMSAGIVVVDSDQSIKLINRAAQGLFIRAGWRDGDSQLPVLSWNLIDLDGNDFSGDLNPFRRLLVDGVDMPDRVLGIRLGTNEGLVWGIFNGFASYSVAQCFDRVVLTFVDVTAQVRAEEQQRVLKDKLAQESKLKSLGTLAGGVAHDFNNILAAILGNLGLLKEDICKTPCDDEILVSLEAARVAAQRGRELVRQIMAFSRKQPIRLMRVSPQSILVESSGLVRSALPPHTHLEVKVSDAPPDILGDATQLVQVLVNLGINAVQALREQDGKITFCLDVLSPEDASIPRSMVDIARERGVHVVRFRVVDNGCGMDEKTQKHIFEPFFTTKSVGKGTGLGLSVVHGVVESHQGVLTVKSEVGRGSEFSVFLLGLSAPVMTTADITAVVPELLTCSPSKSSILYLDDDPAVLRLVGNMLNRAGYRCECFQRAEDALLALRSEGNRFDLILTDFNMPEVNGLDFAQAVLRLNPRMRIVLFSGCIDDDLGRKGREVGIEAMLLKSDEIENIDVTVGKLLERCA